MWEFRDLLRAFAVRDVKLRYRQTALGIAWVVLQPLLAAGALSFVFGRIAKLPSNGVPYFVFSYAGLLCWTAFNSTLTKASSSVVGNSAMVSKVFFPRMLLPLSVIGSTLIDFGVALLMMAVLLAVTGVSPGVGILLLPLWFALTLALGIGLGLVTCALAVRYRDVQYVIPVATQLLLYISPVAYAAGVVPPSARTFFMANPLAGLLEAFRWSLLGQGDLSVLPVVWAATATVVALVGGAYAFASLERSFADVI